MITCSKCGFVMSSDNKFCSQCGQPVSSTSATTSTSTKTTSTDSSPTTSRSRKPILLVTSILVIAVILGLILSICNASTNKGYIIYADDDECFISHGKQYKPVLVFDDKYEFASAYGFSKNGSQFLITDEDGALYFLDINSKNAPVKLSSDFSQAFADEKFKVFTYVKDNAIYQCNAKGNPIRGEKKIQSKVDSIEIISRDSNIIYYTNTDEDIYVKVGRKDAQLVCLCDDYDDVLGTSKDYKTIYYINNDNELYSKTIGKDAEKIVSDVKSVHGFESSDTYYTPITDGTFYAITSNVLSSDGDQSAISPGSTTTFQLYYVNGKNCTAISEELEGYSLSIKTAKDEDAAIIYLTNEEDTTYYMVSKDKMAEWEEDVDSIYGISANGEYVYYTDSLDEESIGDLYRAKISTKPAKGTLINEDVSGTKLLPNGSILYFKDVDEETHCDLYLDEKKLAEGVYASWLRVSYHEDSNKVIFLTDYNSEKNRGTLCQYTGKVKTVAEDVYSASFTESGLIYYLTDYKDGEGTLYVSNKKNPIAEDVSAVLSSYDLFSSY